MSKKSLQFLGIAFFTQAVTVLIGGAVFFDAYVVKYDIKTTLQNFENNLSVVYGGIILQIVTAIVIVVLGVLLYRAIRHISKTLSTLALVFYILEATLLIISQAPIFVFTRTMEEQSMNWFINLLYFHDFFSKMAIIPFGLGAIIFYFLLSKAKIIPKWLMIWGLITVPFVLIGVPLTAFGVEVPFLLFVPYVPWEFFTGLYILIRSSRIANND